MYTLVPLRPWTSTDLSPPAPGPAARLAFAQYGPVAGGVRTVRVAGIAVDIEQVVVEVTTPLGTAADSVSLDAGTHHFEVEVPEVPAPVAAAVYYIAVVDPTSGSTMDHGAFTLALPDIDLASATLAGLDGSRSQFLAGTSDRVVQRRSFSSLSVEPVLTKPRRTKKKPGWFLPWYITSRTHSTVPAVNTAAFAGQLEKSLPQIFRQLHSGQLGLDKFDAQITRHVTGAIERSTQRLNGKQLQAMRKRVGPAPAGPVPQARFMVSAAADTKDDILDSGLVVGPDLDFAFDDWLVEHLKELFWRVWRDTPVGIMFLDRLRYRPAGLVVGEQLYTLALTPGEEVQLRQVVETKRRDTFEDVETREQEQSLSLSATWSTDVTEALGSTDSSQTAVNLGSNLNIGPAPEVPIGVGTTMGMNTSNAHTLTTQWSAHTNQQRSAQATAKQRSEHKTRIEITNESSSGLTSTRTIRNANRQRNATFVFSKIYRREHATLERHDARLCLRLAVNDPSGPFRGAFLAGLAKIDPNEPALYDAPLDGKVHATWSERLHSPPRAHGGHVAGPVSHETTFPWDVEFPGDVRLSDGEKVPTGYVLASTPSIRMDQFKIFDTGNEYFKNAPQWNTRSSVFHQLGGQLAWDSTRTPGKMQGMTSGRLLVTIEDVVYPGELENEWYGISAVDVTITSKWVPSAELEIEVQAKYDTRRQELVQALLDGAFVDLRDSVDMDYEGSVVAQAVRTHIERSGQYPISYLRQIFEFEEAVVESVPYWCTQAGQTHYAHLRARLESLPVPVNVDSLLTRTFTDAEAIVYLPVQPGLERAALDALRTRIKESEKTRLVSEINDFRQQHFSAVAPPASGYDAVLGPAPPSGTLAGQRAWESTWEGPRAKFDVLAEWQELVPTDGVHIETVLSDSDATDEAALFELHRQSRQ